MNIQDTKNLIADLVALGSDPGRLGELQTTCDQMTTKLSETRSAISDLRPGVKNYDSELGRLASISTALEVGLASGLAELEQEVKRTRIESLHNQTKSGELDGEIQALDVKILDQLAGVWEMLLCRSSLVDELKVVASTLANIVFDYRLGEFSMPVVFPWRLPISGGSASQASLYVKRFIEMRMGAGPVPDQTLLQWFSRTRF